jgi:hypothetical protein
MLSKNRDPSRSLVGCHNAINMPPDLLREPRGDKLLDPHASYMNASESSTRGRQL